jgi:hypothetical protein
MSWLLGSSERLVFGLIDTRQFQNNLLFATAKAFKVCVSKLVNYHHLEAYLVITGNKLGHSQH